MRATPACANRFCSARSRKVLVQQLGVVTIGKTIATASLVEASGIRRDVLSDPYFYSARRGLCLGIRACSDLCARRPSCCPPRAPRAPCLRVLRRPAQLFAGRSLTPPSDASCASPRETPGPSEPAARASCRALVGHSSSTRTPGPRRPRQTFRCARSPWPIAAPSRCPSRPSCAEHSVANAPFTSCRDEAQHRARPSAPRSAHFAVACAFNH